MPSTSQLTLSELFIPNVVVQKKARTAPKSAHILASTESLALLTDKEEKKIDEVREKESD